ncbi:MAG TPA: metalloregulator ArsR/SmtB family transcription factor [Candidatus Binataceae bacterium]|nr:metalloregulator ArsR/SmtB family transcription factor [Candidatus Binataceae bacterium]
MEAAAKFVEQLNALGQHGRLEIFRLLVHSGPQGRCVDEIRHSVAMPGSTMSHHLDTLTRSGLLTSRRAGRFIYYAVDWEAASGLIRFLTDDCCADMRARFGGQECCDANALSACSLPTASKVLEDES